MLSLHAFSINLVQVCQALLVVRVPALQIHNEAKVILKSQLLIVYAHYNFMRYFLCFPLSSETYPVKL